MASGDRGQALQRMLSMMGTPSPEDAQGQEPGEDEDTSTPEGAAQEAIELLQPFMEDPRIAKAAQMLAEIAGGPDSSGEPDSEMGGAAPQQP